MSSSFTMYTTPWCGYCHRLKSQLDREGIPFDIVDIEQDPSATQIVESANNGNQTVPTLVYSDGTAQTNPSLVQVKDKLAALASEPQGSTGFTGWPVKLPRVGRAPGAHR